MSTALSESFHVDPEHDDIAHTISAPHLKPVDNQALTIVQRSEAIATNVQQPARRQQVLRDPSDEYAPAHRVPGVSSNVVRLRNGRAQELADKRYLLQRDSIKNMTRTIGAAFVEAELGLRPFMQLSSWMEMELFQKLRARVERTVNGKYLAAKCNDTGVTKVPSITPVGVRAALRENGDWETSMTIRVGQRARAIAMRLQLHRERWKVIAFEIG